MKEKNNISVLEIIRFRIMWTRIFLALSLLLPGSSSFVSSKPKGDRLTIALNRPLRFFQSIDIRKDSCETEPTTATVEREPAWFEQLQESLLAPLRYQKPPPLQVEDNSVLLYDVILLVNLSASISFWVTHRMDFQYIGSAISEGSLLSILWIIAGLYHGAFLYSAVDGHYGSMDEKGGPKAAGLLGLQTFISTFNLRIVMALLIAVIEHRKVGDVAGEELIPLELIFGLVLMSCWRALHSSYTPRM